VNVEASSAGIRRIDVGRIRGCGRARRRNAARRRDVRGGAAAEACSNRPEFGRFAVAAGWDSGASLLPDRLDGGVPARGGRFIDGDDPRGVDASGQQQVDRDAVLRYLAASVFRYPASAGRSRPCGTSCCIRGRNVLNRMKARAGWSDINDSIRHRVVRLRPGLLPLPPVRVIVVCCRLATAAMPWTLPLPAVSDGYAAQAEGHVTPTWLDILLLIACTVLAASARNQWPRGTVVLPNH
jgi:hypothetical protein